MRSRRHLKSSRKFLELLEPRQLLSATPQINFANFSSTTGLVSNGFDTAPIRSGNQLELTDGQTYEARAVFYETKVPIDTFTSHFSFQIGGGSGDPSGAAEADGFTFVIDNGTFSDLGSSGRELGYAGGTFGAGSVALEFNAFNQGNFGSTFAFAQGGNDPTTSTSAAPVDFHAGDVINATVTYDGTTLSVQLVDASTNATFTDSEAIDLYNLFSGHSALVGFTAATGGDDSVQEINNWDFTGTLNSTADLPTIATPAAASPVPASGTKAHLAIAASSNDGGTLSYNWTLLHKPSGAATPTFTANNSATANHTIAHFFKAGTYIFRVTVNDSKGTSSVSDVAELVRQTATQIKIEPHKPQIFTNSTQQFTASMYDQFSHIFEVQPTFSYAIVIGGGSIGGSTGLYSAGATAGHLLISASADDLTGEAGATIIS